jgi:integrative and conjugative element protein (TIGR02256 family)
MTLDVPEEVLEPIAEHLSQSGFGVESGGIILGGKVEGENRYIVKEMTLPSPEDESGPFSFIRNAEPANKLISRAWKESDGTTNYLGEWHTHNEETPRPSFVDKDLIQQVISEKSSLFDCVFMIIIGNSGQAFVGMADNTIHSEIFKDNKIVGLLNHQL